MEDVYRVGDTVDGLGVAIVDALLFQEPKTDSGHMGRGSCRTSACHYHTALGRALGSRRGAPNALVVLRQALCLCCRESGCPKRELCYDGNDQASGDYLPLVQTAPLYC